ncbi:hypothetical protein GCM10023195_60810 [Actinoallomurus liliacearum]|uniref:Uncharacterized protein n=1 Tax=Actinoallomurus liliacearum TaxID=1080073 RepID=A0ABP8TQC7_9ACTN
MNEIDRNQALTALVNLCRELAKLGVNVGLSDARPAISVRGGLASRKVWIQIDPSGESFVWQRDDRALHAADDPAGAAARIAEYIKKRDAAPGERW